MSDLEGRTLNSWNQQLSCLDHDPPIPRDYDREINRFSSATQKLRVLEFFNHEVFNVCKSQIAKYLGFIVTLLTRKRRKTSTTECPEERKFVLGKCVVSEIAQIGIQRVSSSPSRPISNLLFKNGS